MFFKINTWGEESFLEKLEELFLPGCETISRQVKGGVLISDLTDYTEKQVADVAFRDVYMPWNRTFEISFSIDVEPLIPVA